MADLSGKTVVIIGVGAGLGRETALVAAREGGNVVLGARTESVLESVAKEVEAAGGQAAYRRLRHQQTRGLPGASSTSRSNVSVRSTA